MFDLSKKVKTRKLLAEAVWKNGAKEGNSPVSENGFQLFVVILKYGEKRQPRRNPAALIRQG